MILDRLTIILPWPDMSLMPNRKNGKHWGSTVAIKVQAKQDAFLATKSALGRHTLSLTEINALTVVFAAPDGRRRDLDNLLSSQKSAIDGIAQALGIDDSQFTRVTIESARDANKRGFIKVEIGQ